MRKCGCKRCSGVIGRGTSCTALGLHAVGHVIIKKNKKIKKIKKIKKKKKKKKKKNKKKLKNKKNSLQTDNQKFIEIKKK
ncbi:hypothetical protein PP707_02390 [Acetobacter pasteurianus]|nr:hypothetical protein [Acetobacter pasteurianus]